MSPRKPTRAVQLGVTDDDYARMLEEQDGHCALCPSTPKTRRFSVDHDHATGAVRGLLCHRCNRALPTWITPTWLHAAARYLHDDAPSAWSDAARDKMHGYALDNSTAVVLAPSANSATGDLTTG